jgi:glycosyltransferase involved in cell wall biosynthesis
MITIDDSEMLADEILWAIENPSIRNEAVQENRQFIEKQLNYKTNMKIIADKYHELIDDKKNNRNVC